MRRVSIWTFKSNEANCAGATTDQPAHGMGGMMRLRNAEAWDAHYREHLFDTVFRRATIGKSRGGAMLGDERQTAAIAHSGKS
eukprot:6186976-Pleurochrysis_carterae.AAC.5